MMYNITTAWLAPVAAKFICAYCDTWVTTVYDLLQSKLSFAIQILR